MRFQMREAGSAAGMILLCAIATFTAVASATPTITFPLNSQVPPVARVGQPFTFSFSPSTFTSDTAINYTLKSAPAWLSLNGRTRKLSGTPPKDASPAFTIDIEAEDTTGSIVMTSTLVVLSGAAPEVAIPLSSQIVKFGESSAPSSLLFLPSTSFSFSFDPATFGTSENASLNKYAVTLDNAPLPSWISFDAATMTFSGKTPDSSSLVSPPEQFGIQLIASGVVGFAEVSIPFFFVVENHKLVWKDSFLTVNSSVGSAISLNNLAEKLELDGEPVASSDLVAIISDAPEWLKIDNSTFALSGTVPSETQSFNVTIIAVDKFDDVAAAMISIVISGGIFVEQDFPPLNATIGEPFSFNISTAFVNPANIDISVSIVPESSWLSYDSKTFVLSGQVPDSTTVSSVTVTLSAGSKPSLSKRANDSKSFTINIVSPPVETPNRTDSPATSLTSAPATSIPATSIPAASIPAAITKQSESKKGITGGQLAAAVVVPNVILILAVLLLFLCWRRRQHRQLNEKASFVPMKKDISRPQLHDPPSLLTPSSTSSIHQGLRSHPLGYGEDTSDFTRPGYGRRSISMPKMTSDSRSHPLHRSISDNYITYGPPSLPSTQLQTLDRSAKISTTQTPTKKRESEWRYKPYRNFSDQSDTSGSIQITPEASYMHNYGQYRISKPKTRNYLGSIAGLPSQRGSVVGHGRNMSSVSTQTYDTPVRHPWSGHGGALPGHGGPNAASMDSSKSWLTVEPSPQKSVGRGRPNSTMSAVTENTDLLYEYSNLPQLPPPVATPSTDRSSSNHQDTIRIVSRSSDQQLLSSNTLESRSSSIARPITRRGGSSPFFGGSARTNSHAARRRPTKVVEGYMFSDETSPSILERDETNASLERSILSELQMDSSSLASRSNSRANIGRDVLGINYGGQTPDMVSRTRKSRVYAPGYKSPEESTRELQTFITDIRHRPSWQDSRQPSVLSPSNLSDASSRFREATSSPPAFTFRSSNARDDKENEDTMSRYSEDTKEYAREAWQNKYASYTSNVSGRSMGTGTFRDSMGNSIRYDDDDSPQLTSAAYVERPSLLTPYSSRFGESVFTRSTGPLSPGLDPSWRLTPVSPRPLDLGAGRVKEGPARRGTVRMSHGRKGSLSIVSFLENGGHGDAVLDEEEWDKRIEEERTRAQREHTLGQAFL